MARVTDLWRHRTGTDGFEELLRPYVPAMYRLAYRFTGNPDDAEDLLQDLLLRLYPRREELAGIDRLHPWLARVLYRLHVDRGRRDRRWPTAFSELPDHDPDPQSEQSGRSEPDPPSTDTAGQPEESLERALTHRRLQAALDQLSEAHRLVVIMHDVEGFTLEEIELVVEVPLGTLKSRLHRARNRLRSLLTGSDGTFSADSACHGAER